MASSRRHGLPLALLLAACSGRFGAGLACRKLFAGGGGGQAGQGARHSVLDGAFQLAVSPLKAGDEA